MIAEFFGFLILVIIAVFIIGITLAFALPGLIVFFYNGPPLKQKYVSKNPYDYDEDN
jgi:hypothetical protein